MGKGSDYMKVKLVRVNSMHFERIRIPQRFADNPPKPDKLIHKMLVFSRESELDDILVDENMWLVDGYCAYLIAQQVGPEFVRIKMIKGC
jgi:hypothetical protein